MKKRNMIQRIVSILLAVLLLLSLCPLAFADDDRVYIGTQQELVEFAERCASETYSKGLTVLLTSEIGRAHV